MIYLIKHWDTTEFSGRFELQWVLVSGTTGIRLDAPFRKLQLSNPGKPPYSKSVIHATTVITRFLQFGGNDQIGNMQTGYEFVDKIRPRTPLFGLGDFYSINCCFFKTFEILIIFCSKLCHWLQLLKAKSSANQLVMPYGSTRNSFRPTSFTSIFWTRAINWSKPIWKCSHSCHSTK